MKETSPSGDASIQQGGSGPPLAIFSHLRWIAATLVVISHFRANLVSDYSGGSTVAKLFYAFSGFGHQAVVLFFVLSGFLVGKKLRLLLQNGHLEWGGYILDRFVRIFIVLIPALIFSWICLEVSLRVAPGLHNWSPALQGNLSEDLSLERWAGAISLTNGIFAPTLVVNGPLWSLAYEWCYYAIGLAAVLLIRRRWGGYSFLPIVYGSAVVISCAVFNPAILIGGISWVFGVLSSVVYDRLRLPRFLSAVLVLGAIAAFLLSRWIHVPDPVLGFVAAAALADRKLASLNFGAKWGERLSSFSYTLYATHFPLSVVVAAALYRLHNGTRLTFGLSAMLAVVACSLTAGCVAKLVAIGAEDRTIALKLIIARKIGIGRTRRVDPTSSAGHESPLREPRIW